MNKSEIYGAWFLVSVISVLWADDPHWQGVGIISAGLAAFAFLNSFYE